MKRCTGRRGFSCAGSRRTSAVTGQVNGANSRPRKHSPFEEPAKDGRFPRMRLPGLPECKKGIPLLKISPTEDEKAVPTEPIPLAECLFALRQGKKAVAEDRSCIPEERSCIPEEQSSFPEQLFGLRKRLVEFRKRCLPFRWNHDAAKWRSCLPNADPARLGKLRSPRRHGSIRQGPRRVGTRPSRQRPLRFLICRRCRRIDFLHALDPRASRHRCWPAGG